MTETKQYIEIFLDRYRDKDGNIPTRPEDPMSSIMIAQYMERVRREEAISYQKTANMRFRG